MKSLLQNNKPPGEDPEGNPPFFGVLAGLYEERASFVARREFFPSDFTSDPATPGGNKLRVIGIRRPVKSAGADVNGEKVGVGFS